MSNAKELKITINDDTKTFTGRVVGVIDNDTIRAIINTEDAARKISTSESLTLQELKCMVTYGKALVFVTSDFERDYVNVPKKVVMITDTIRSSSITLNDAEYVCEDGTKYSIVVK